MVWRTGEIRRQTGHARKARNVEFMIGSMRNYLNQEKEEEKKEKEQEHPLQLEKEQTAGQKKEEGRMNSGSVKEEEGNGWLRSDWGQGGWILKQPEEKEGNYWRNPKGEEREEEDTPKGRLEIEDRKQGEYNLTAQGHSSSYFSNFSSSSSQKMRMKPVTRRRREKVNGGRLGENGQIIKRRTPLPVREQNPDMDKLGNAT